MSEGVDPGPGPSTLNALLSGPPSLADPRQTPSGRIPSPQPPEKPPTETPTGDSPDSQETKKEDPDWENDSETEISESDSGSESDDESDSESSDSQDGDSSDSDDDKSEDKETNKDLVNGHSEQSTEKSDETPAEKGEAAETQTEKSDTPLENFVPEVVFSTEESNDTPASQDVCSDVLSDLLKTVVPSPPVEPSSSEDVKFETFCSETSDSQTAELSTLVNIATQDSAAKSLDSAPTDFLDQIGSDFLDSIDRESSQDVKSLETVKPDENQGKKKKKRKRKREEEGTGRKRKRKEDGEGKRRKREPGEKKRKKAKKEDKEVKKGDKHDRKNIRKIIADDDLDAETRTAQQEEMDRKKRLQELQRNAVQQNNVHLKALLQSSDEDEDKGDEKVNKAFSKNKDVVTISSSDEDDVVMLDEKKKAAAKPESDSDDDPNDAGCHSNDILNIPDEEGRVLVNVGHPKEDPDIFVNERVATALKPHQVGGIRFLYDNLIESVDHFKSSNGFGCILAHSMGLGKTIQVVTFVDIFLRNTNAKYVLCIVPINTLQNWVNEFNMWLPPDPSKVAPPPPPKPAKERKEEKANIKQEKNEFDPFGMNSMNYPWMNSGFQQQAPPQHSSQQQMAGSWNQYGYGNGGQWDAHVAGGQMGASSMMPGPMSQSGMGTQNPFGYGQYPQIKQEYPSYGQQSYGGYGQYGQYPPSQYGQDSYGASMNSAPYGMQNQSSQQYLPPYPPQKDYLNGPTSEIPKFPPLTPPPESNPGLTNNSYQQHQHSTSANTQGPASLKSNNLSGSMNSMASTSSAPQIGAYSTTMSRPSSTTSMPNTTNSVNSSANNSNSNGPCIKTEPSDATETQPTIKIEPGIKTEPKTEVKKEEESKKKEEVKKKEEKKTAIDPDLADTPWRAFEVYVLSDNHKTMAARSKVVGEWKKSGGVLLMGYEMYRLLATRKSRKRPPRKADSKKVIDVDQEDKDNELAIDIQSALLKPGPDLVICDEGHRIKNSHAGISQALKNIKTRRRVVLTGYPLQNNLLEYWCMVDFVRPNFLGSKSEFSNMFERPIMNGQCHDSTAQDGKVMRYRAHVLHSLLEGFVQRRGHTVLRAALPPKAEYVVLVKMSDIQRRLYTTFMARVNDAEVAEWATANPIKAFSVMCKIWNHPDILFKIVKRLKDGNLDDDLDLADDAKGEEEGATGAVKKRGKKPRGRGKKAGAGAGAEEAEGEEKEEKGNVGNTITYDWAQDLMASYIPGNLNNGGKMLCMFTIMEESIAIGDKILIFSQSLFTLNLIEEFLSQAYVPVPGCEERWTKNRHYYRLDGSTSASDREKMVNTFNNPDNNLAWLFLLSTRAGCLGINLTGANRVIVYDASWNPCHDCQAVCRVYRYGQQKPCFIYRLVSDNTMEKKIYDRQVSKQTISDRVVDELNPETRISRKQMEDLLHYEEKKETTIEVTDELLDKYEDPVVQSMLRNNGDIITKIPFTHESLLIDQREYKLSKAEKNMARLSYEREKKMSAYGGYTRPSYANYYPKAGANSLITGLPGSNLVINRSLATPLPRTGTAKAVDGKTGANTGVTVHQIVTTTDIVVPGSGKDPKSQYKIPAGQQVLVIKTPRGVYIRTPEGKIFAVRTAGKIGNETGITGLGTPVSGAGTSTGGGAGTPLASSAALGAKSLLSKGPGGGLTTTPRILGSLRRRAGVTPSIRLTTPRPTLGAGLIRQPTPTQQPVINLDDSDSEPSDEASRGSKPKSPARMTSNGSEKLVTIPLNERKGQISLIKPIGGLNDPPPQSVKVIMKPPVSRQSSTNSEGSKSPRSEMTSVLKRSPLGSPASAKSPATISSDSNDDSDAAKAERSITLVRPPGHAKKPAARTQIFLSRSSDDMDDKTGPGKTTTAGSSGAVTSTATATEASGVMAAAADMTSSLSGLLASGTQSNAEQVSRTTASGAKPFQSMTDILASGSTSASSETRSSVPGQAVRPATSTIPAFSQPYKNAASQVTASQQPNMAAPGGSNMAAGNNMASVDPSMLHSGGTMTEQQQQQQQSQKMKQPTNWMLPDKNKKAIVSSSQQVQAQTLPSFSNLSQNRTDLPKNPLESMMSMTGFGGAWGSSNPYSAPAPPVPPVPASQPLPPWSMDSQFADSSKKRRDPFAAQNYSQQDYQRYNSSYSQQPMDYFNNPYYQQPQQNQYPSFQNYPRNFGSAANSSSSSAASSYYNNQSSMFSGQPAGDFRYGQTSLPPVPNSLESMSQSFDSGGGDASSLKWQTAFTHAQTSSGNSASFPSQRSSVPDLPDLSSLGEF